MSVMGPQGLMGGDRVRVTDGGKTTTYTVFVASEEWIIVKSGVGAMHIRWSAGLGAWTVGGRKVEVAKA